MQKRTHLWLVVQLKVYVWVNLLHLYKLVLVVSNFIHNF